MGQRMGAPFHVVVEDRPASPGRRWGVQVAACGATFVQSDAWVDMAPRAYLRTYSCPRCLAIHPVPSEDDDGRWPGWGHLAAVPAPLFPAYASAESSGHPAFARWLTAWRAARATTEGGSNPMQCGECGKRLTPGAAVCEECGTEVFGADPDAEVAHVTHVERVGGEYDWSCSGCPAEATGFDSAEAARTAAAAHGPLAAGSEDL